MKELFLSIIENLKARNIQYCKRIIARYNGRWVPEKQYIWLDALNEEDIPHRIAENSVYIIFSVDLKAQTIEVYRTGSVYLSESDKQTDRYKFYVMKSMTNVLKDNGGKAFRKQKYKDVNQLCDKIEKYFVSIMKEVEAYTGGYPYKKGI